ncbi:MAG: OsmC family protein [Nitrospirota bacterium]
MVRISIEPEKCRCHVISENFETFSDAATDKGGKNNGFRPHELLEAAYAACLNMSIRDKADREKIPLENVVVSVNLDRSNPKEVVFKYKIQLPGSLTEEQKRALRETAESCPVRKTLSRTIKFSEIRG